MDGNGELTFQRMTLLFITIDSTYEFNQFYYL
eukprot:CAMPEP_0206158174 /NCGR_PEP_ID=MMETSP1474-20131121/4588_1 /ASSEMBLY_ACC=CAM_ASM_001110 /TAXON_ID=97495 /ORGANISM="Imantonia sp., Strain RCC918" /LENGTH=31 /DNA_ID= /DNA_START= /DNA_END= /DNA_ORIENTATION=